MKKMLLIAIISLSYFYAAAQTDTLPAMNFPSIPYSPTIKKGWTGQFVYEIHFDGESSGKFGTFKQFYKVKADCVHTGFIEFPAEVRGAIRTNQPDKNNTTRWESWIRSGTSFTFSNVDVTIQSAEQTTNMANDAISGTIEKKMTYSSAGNWAKGWLSNTDLQIDHTEGKYSFAVPYVEFEQPGTEQIITTALRPAKKDTLNRSINAKHDFRDLTYIQPIDWFILEGNFKKGQNEIIIRRRIPLLLQQTVTSRGKNVKLSAAKGYMDYYMVLKRIG